MTREEIQQQLNGIKDIKMSNYTDKRIEKLMTHCKAIHQYDLEGNYIQSFESISLASHKIGSDLTSHMASHIDGKRKVLMGFMWRYDKVDKLVDVVLHSQKQKVNLYDLNGKLVKSFNTVSDLTKFLYPNQKKGLSLKSLQQNTKKKYVIKKV